MLTINHSICPECSIGCGINVISKNGKILGINPYKNHPINEGKNCKNCIDNINEIIDDNQEKTFDYDNKLEEITQKIQQYPSNEITVITSGKTDNDDLESIIKFTTANDYNIVAYENNFIKIDPKLIASYSEIEEADQIIIIGDVYRKNSLIARRIIHAQENNNAKTININTTKNLTGYNSDKFIQISSYDEIKEKLEDINITDKTVLIINETENYQQITDFVKNNNIKILPLLKNPNSYSILEKIEKTSKEDISYAINNSKLLLFINEETANYESFDINDKEIITISSLTDETIDIPVKNWCEKEGSFTNAEGKTQYFTDAIQDKNNTLKTVGEVLKIICNKL